MIFSFYPARVISIIIELNLIMIKVIYRLTTIYLYGVWLLFLIFTVSVNKHAILMHDCVSCNHDLKVVLGDHLENSLLHKTCSVEGPVLLAADVKNPCLR